MTTGVEPVTTFGAATPWVDLPTAARLTGVPHTVLLAAAAKGLIPATVTHPQRPGDWLTHLAAAERLAAHRLPDAVRVA